MPKCKKCGNTKRFRGTWTEYNEGYMYYTEEGLQLDTKSGMGTDDETPEHCCECGSTDIEMDCKS